MVRYFSYIFTTSKTDLREMHGPPFIKTPVRGCTRHSVRIIIPACGGIFIGNSDW